MRIIETDHIVRKRNHSLACKADAPRWDAAVLVICHASVRPVPMGVENCREWAFALAQWPIQISSHVKSRQRLEINFFDAVTIALDLAEDVRFEWPLRRHGPQAAAHKNVFANFASALLPLFAREITGKSRGVSSPGRDGSNSTCSRRFDSALG
jgi:hypothetical protein